MDKIREETEGILFIDNRSDCLLISFGGINQNIGMPVFEFLKTIESINADKIFIKDSQQAWYHKGINSEIDSIDKLAEFIQEIIQSKKYKKCVLIGNSMGGFAAIAIGALLNVDSVIAFSPQSFISKLKRFIYNDKRWGQQIKKVHELSGKKYLDLKSIVRTSNCKIIVHYSSQHKLDRDHALRLSQCKNISLIDWPTGGHAVVKELRNQNLLLDIIRQELLSE
ncbi:hypothetical protein KO507_08600 [Gilvimarinus agarilyticus]|nr:hypothetical protein [Gilvimarinus agarilyticus]